MVLGRREDDDALTIRQRQHDSSSPEELPITISLPASPREPASIARADPPQRPRASYTRLAPLPAASARRFHHQRLGVGAECSRALCVSSTTWRSPPWERPRVHELLCGTLWTTRAVRRSDGPNTARRYAQPIGEPRGKWGLGPMIVTSDVVPQDAATR